MQLEITYTTGTGTTPLQFNDTDVSHAAVGTFATAAEFQRAAIQYAVDNAVPNSGQTQGVVSLSAGVFTVSAAGLSAADGVIRLPSNIVLEGVGKAYEATGLSTTIKLADGTDHDVTGIVRTASGGTEPNITTTTNVDVRNLTIDGNAAGVATNLATGEKYEVDGFYTGPKPGTALADTDIVLDGVEILNMTRYGFDPHEQTVDLSISNSVAHANGLDGFAIDFCSDVTLSNNLAFDNGRHGFNIITSSSNVTMTGNISRDNGGSGIVVQTGDNEARALTQNVTILGGAVYGNADEGIVLRQVGSIYLGTNASGTISSGVNVYDNGKAGLLIDGSSNVKVKNNSIFGNTLTVDSSGLGRDSEIYIKGYKQTYFADQNNDEIDDDPLNDLFRQSTNVTIESNLIGSASGNTSSRGISFNDDALGLSEAGLLSSNTFYGSFANPTQTGSSQANGVPFYSYLITSGDDPINGTAGSDTIAAGNGNDTVSGFGGADLLYGNDGNDVLLGGAGADTLSGGFGSDTASYAGSAVAVNITIGGAATGGDAQGDVLISIENLAGGNGADTLTGGDGANALSGNGGNDRLFGGTGADTMNGGAGNDTYWVDNALDVIAGEGAGSDVDTLWSSTSFNINTPASGAAFVEVLRLMESGGAINGTGNALANTIHGNAFNNVLAGGAGNDTIFGNAGNDTLYGWGGNDVLAGGAGIDTYVFDLTPNAATNRDNITDFNSTDDVIRLSASIFTGIPVGVNGFMFGTAFYAAPGATQANDSSDRIVYNTNTGALYYDRDGAGGVAAVHFATLTTKPAIIAADFLVL